MKGVSPEVELSECMCCEKELPSIEMCYCDEKVLCWECAGSYFDNQNRREDDDILRWEIPWETE